MQCIDTTWNPTKIRDADPLAHWLLKVIRCATSFIFFFYLPLDVHAEYNPPVSAKRSPLWTRALVEV
jgi:hypothetical protein